MTTENGAAEKSVEDLSKNLQDQATLAEVEQKEELNPGIYKKFLMRKNKINFI